MVGNLRAQLGRVAREKGSWVVCSLLLASTLLTGCNGSSSTSASDAAATGNTTGAVVTQSTSTSTPTTAAKSIDVTWTAPTANTNGSALTDLAGYTIHYGTNPSALSQSVDVPNAGASDQVVQGLTGGTWYFAVTAYTNTGLQSGYSSVVSKTIT